MCFYIITCFLPYLCAKRYIFILLVSWSAINGIRLTYYKTTMINKHSFWHHQHLVKRVKYNYHIRGWYYFNIKIFLLFQDADSRPCNTGTELDTICKYELVKRVIRTFGSDIFGLKNYDAISSEADFDATNKRTKTESSADVTTGPDIFNSSSIETSHHRSKRTASSACVQTCFTCFLLGEHRTMKMCMTACIAGITITCPGALEWEYLNSCVPSIHQIRYRYSIYNNCIVLHCPPA